MSLKRDVELLYEIGSIRFIQRTWKQFLGPDFANLTEHHFRVTWLALLLAKMEGKGDTGKIAKMALVHDLAESRTGDVNYISRQYTKRDDKKAIQDILKDTALGQEFLEIWHEYEEKKTIESKLVKDADWLDVDLEIQEQKAMGRKQMDVWNKERGLISKLLLTKSAKKLWKAIWSSTATDWYHFAPNRYTAGDFKPKLQALKKKGKK